MHSFHACVDGEYFALSAYDHFRDYFGQGAERVEVETRDWFVRSLCKDDVVFDIGANVGLYTVLFAKKAGSVWAFEPTDTYENFLVPNLRRNGVEVSTHRLAFGDKVGVHEDGIFKVWGKPAEVMCYDFDTLDSFVASRGVVPTYLKIDVDSFEVEVLRGGVGFLTDHSPTVVIEINEEALGKRGYSGDDVRLLMAGLGYSNVMTLDFENHVFRRL